MHKDPAPCLNRVFAPIPAALMSPSAAFPSRTVFTDDYDQAADRNQRPDRNHSRRIAFLRRGPGTKSGAARLRSVRP